MTPMQKVKPYIEDLKNNLTKNFLEINLNKSAYKKGVDLGYAIEYEKKGVKSDFIKILKIDSKPNNYSRINMYSLSFVFKYIGLEESEQTISYLLKITDSRSKKDTFYSSDSFSVNEFKEKIQLINKIIKEKEGDKHIVEIINTINFNLLTKPPRLAVPIITNKK